MSRFEDRDRMCREAFGIFGDNVRVLPVEALWKTQYTVDMLTRLMETPDYYKPGDELVLLMGEDEWVSRNQWHQWETIQAKVQILVIGRQGCLGQRRVQLPDVSSSGIRDSIRNGGLEFCSDLLLSQVMDFIHKFQIYC